MSVNSSKKELRSDKFLYKSEKNLSPETEDSQPGQKSTHKPKMGSRYSPTSPKGKAGQFSQLRNSQTTSSIPKLVRKNESSTHQRQHSEPAIVRIKPEGRSSHSKQKKDWIATFNALSEKKPDILRSKLTQAINSRRFWSGRAERKFIH